MRTSRLGWIVMRRRFPASYGATVYAGMYQAVDAQRCAEQRRRKAKTGTCKVNRPEILAYVQERLRKCWSPDQIAGRSRVDFPGNPGRTVSHQTIYHWLARDDHRRRWLVYLRRYPRKRRHARSVGRVDRALAKRPAIVNERGRYGDWEGDTIVGSGRHGGALVEHGRTQERLRGAAASPQQTCDRCATRHVWPTATSCLLSCVRQ